MAPKLLRHNKVLKAIPLSPAMTGRTNSNRMKIRGGNTAEGMDGLHIEDVQQLVQTEGIIQLQYLVMEDCRMAKGKLRLQKLST